MAGLALAAMLRVLSQGYTAGRVVSVAAGCACHYDDAAAVITMQPGLVAARDFFCFTLSATRMGAVFRPGAGADVVQQWLCDLRMGYPKDPVSPIAVGTQPSRYIMTTARNAPQRKDGISLRVTARCQPCRQAGAGPA